MLFQSNSCGTLRNPGLCRWGGCAGHTLPTRKCPGNSVFPEEISGSLTTIFLILRPEKPPAGVHVSVETYLCTLRLLGLFYFGFETKLDEGEKVDGDDRLRRP